MPHSSNASNHNSDDRIKWDEVSWLGAHRPILPPLPPLGSQWMIFSIWLIRNQLQHGAISTVNDFSDVFQFWDFNISDIDENLDGDWLFWQLMNSDSFSSPISDGFEFSDSLSAIPTTEDVVSELPGNKLLHLQEERIAEVNTPDFCPTDLATDLESQQNLESQIPQEPIHDLVPGNQSIHISETLTNEEIPLSIQEQVNASQIPLEEPSVAFVQNSEVSNSTKDDDLSTQTSTLVELDQTPGLNLQTFDEPSTTLGEQQVELSSQETTQPSSHDSLIEQSLITHEERGELKTQPQERSPELFQQSNLAENTGYLESAQQPIELSESRELEGEASRAGNDEDSQISELSATEPAIVENPEARQHNLNLTQVDDVNQSEPFSNSQLSNRPFADNPIVSEDVAEPTFVDSQSANFSGQPKQSHSEPKDQIVTQSSLNNNNVNDSRSNSELTSSTEASNSLSHENSIIFIDEEAPGDKRTIQPIDSEATETSPRRQGETSAQIEALSTDTSAPSDIDDNSDAEVGLRRWFNRGVAWLKARLDNSEFSENVEHSQVNPKAESTSDVAEDSNENPPTTHANSEENRLKHRPVNFSEEQTQIFLTPPENIRQEILNKRILANQSDTIASSRALNKSESHKSSDTDVKPLDSAARSVEDVEDFSKDSVSLPDSSEGANSSKFSLQQNRNAEIFSEDLSNVHQDTSIASNSSPLTSNENVALPTERQSQNQNSSTLADSTDSVAQIDADIIEPTSFHIVSSPTSEELIDPPNSLSQESPQESFTSALDEEAERANDFIGTEESVAPDRKDAQNNGAITLSTQNDHHTQARFTGSTDVFDYSSNPGGEPIVIQRFSEELGDTVESSNSKRFEPSLSLEQQNDLAVPHHSDQSESVPISSTSSNIDSGSSEELYTTVASADSANSVTTNSQSTPFPANESQNFNEAISNPSAQNIQSQSPEEVKNQNNLLQSEPSQSKSFATSEPKKQTLSNETPTETSGSTSHNLESFSIEEPTILQIEDRTNEQINTDAADIADTPLDNNQGSQISQDVVEIPASSVPISHGNRISMTDRDAQSDPSDHSTSSESPNDNSANATPQDLQFNSSDQSLEASESSNQESIVGVRSEEAAATLSNEAESSSVLESIQVQDEHCSAEITPDLELHSQEGISGKSLDSINDEIHSPLDELGGLRTRETEQLPENSSLVDAASVETVEANNSNTHSLYNPSALNASIVEPTVLLDHPAASDAISNVRATEQATADHSTSASANEINFDSQRTFSSASNEDQVQNLLQSGETSYTQFNEQVSTNPPNIKLSPAALESTSLSQSETVEGSSSHEASESVTERNDHSVVDITPEHRDSSFGEQIVSSPDDLEQFVDPPEFYPQEPPLLRRQSDDQPSQEQTHLQPEKLDVISSEQNEIGTHPLQQEQVADLVQEMRLNTNTADDIFNSSFQSPLDEGTFIQEVSPVNLEAETSDESLNVLPSQNNNIDSESVDSYQFNTRTSPSEASESPPPQVDADIVEGAFPPESISEGSVIYSLPVSEQNDVERFVNPPDSNPQESPSPETQSDRSSQDVADATSPEKLDFISSENAEISTPSSQQKPVLDPIQEARLNAPASNETNDIFNSSLQQVPLDEVTVIQEESPLKQEVETSNVLSPQDDASNAADESNEKDLEQNAYFPSQPESSTDESIGQGTSDPSAHSSTKSQLNQNSRQTSPEECISPIVDETEPNSPSESLSVGVSDGRDQVLSEDEIDLNSQQISPPTANEQHDQNFAESVDSQPNFNEQPSSQLNIRSSLETPEFSSPEHSVIDTFEEPITSLTTDGEQFVNAPDSDPQESSSLELSRSDRSSQHADVSSSEKLDITSDVSSLEQDEISTHSSQQEHLDQHETILNSADSNTANNVFNSNLQVPLDEVTFIQESSPVYSEAEASNILPNDNTDAADQSRAGNLEQKNIADENSPEKLDLTSSEHDEISTHASQQQPVLDPIQEARFNDPDSNETNDFDIFNSSLQQVPLDEVTFIQEKSPLELEVKASNVLPQQNNATNTADGSREDLDQSTDFPTSPESITDGSIDQGMIEPVDASTEAQPNQSSHQTPSGESISSVVEGSEPNLPIGSPSVELSESNDGYRLIATDDSIPDIEESTPLKVSDIFIDNGSEPIIADSSDSQKSSDNANDSINDLEPIGSTLDEAKATSAEISSNSQSNDDDLVVFLNQQKHIEVGSPLQEPLSTANEYDLSDPWIVSSVAEVNTEFYQEGKAPSGSNEVATNASGQGTNSEFILNQTEAIAPSHLNEDSESKHQQPERSSASSQQENVAGKQVQRAKSLNSKTDEVDGLHQNLPQDLRLAPNELDDYTSIAPENSSKEKINSPTYTDAPESWNSIEELLGNSLPGLGFSRFHPSNNLSQLRSIPESWSSLNDLLDYEVNESQGQSDNDMKAQPSGNWNSLSDVIYALAAKPNPDLEYSPSIPSPNSKLETDTNFSFFEYESSAPEIEYPSRQEFIQAIIEQLLLKSDHENELISNVKQLKNDDFGIHPNSKSRNYSYFNSSAIFLIQESYEKMCETTSLDECNWIFMSTVEKLLESTREEPESFMRTKVREFF